MDQSLDQDSDNDFMMGGASINQSAQETYRDRLLDGLRTSAQESLWSQGEQMGTKQEILNLLKEKYGFDMDVDDEEDEAERQYEEVASSYLGDDEVERQFEEVAASYLKGEGIMQDDSDLRKRMQARQHTLDLSGLKNESPFYDEGKGESESDTEETYPSEGFQARHNTLNLSEFQEGADVPGQDQCSPPGFLEALEEGLRKRKVRWRLSSEEDSSPGNEEQQQTGASENVRLEPKVGDSPELSDCCGVDGESDGGSCASSPLPDPIHSARTHTEDKSTVQGDAMPLMHLPVFKRCRLPTAP